LGHELLKKMLNYTCATRREIGSNANLSKYLFLYILYLRYHFL